MLHTFANRFQKTEPARAVALVQPKVPLLILTAPLTLLVLTVTGSSFCENISAFTASRSASVPNSVEKVSMRQYDEAAYELNQLCGQVAHLQARVALSPTNTVEVNGKDVSRLYQHAALLRLKLLDKANDPSHHSAR